MIILYKEDRMKYEVVKCVNIIITGDYFGFYVDFVRTKYPGELVLVAEYQGWTNVEDVGDESQNESSGVRGVVRE